MLATTDSSGPIPGQPVNGRASSVGIPLGLAAEDGVGGGAGTATGASQPARSPVPFAPPGITLPKGGGAIRGMGEKFDMSPATGTGSFTVPIAVSSGRSGFGPALTLRYDTAAGNGSYGYGWGVALPSISRKTDKGLPLYQDGRESDTFLLSGAEDLVPVLRADGGRDTRSRTVSGTAYRVDRYRPRTEGLFARIERWTAVQTGETHWRTISRDNVTTVYGADNNSRIRAWRARPSAYSAGLSVPVTTTRAMPSSTGTSRRTGPVSH